MNGITFHWLDPKMTGIGKSDVEIARGTFVLGEPWGAFRMIDGARLATGATPDAALANARHAAGFDHVG